MIREFIMNIIANKVFTIKYFWMYEVSLISNQF